MKIKAYVTAIQIKEHESGVFQNEYPQFDVTLHPIDQLQGIEVNGIPMEEAVFQKYMTAFMEREPVEFEINL